MFEIITEAITNPYMLIVLITFLPFLELRASIPYGIIALGRENWWLVFLIAVVVNIALAPLLYFFMDKVLHLFLRVKWIDKIWQKIVVKSQKKIHPYVEKYGVFGLAVFIGIPLPGSGVYSGAIGGYLLGFSFKDFFKAAVIGVLIAGAVVTLVMVVGTSGLGLFVKSI